MAFNDGEPLDAAKLGQLEQELVQLKASVPKIGSSTTSIAVDNSVTNNNVGPQIIGKSIGDKWTLNKGMNTLPVTFDAPMNKTPNSIVVSGRVGTTGQALPAIYVKTQSTSKDGFTAICYAPATMGIYISYIAICY